MSRLEKCRNPHHHAFAEALIVVDRGDLHEPSANPHSDSLAEDQQPDSERLETLYQMLSPLRRDFAKATRGQKRKRSTSPAAHRDPDWQKTELRLLDLRPIVLSEPRLMLDWPSRHKILPVEDNEEEEIERSRRAKLTAIDGRTIMEQSSVSYRACRPTEPTEYRLTSNDSAGPITVLESRRQKPGSQPVDSYDNSQPVSRDPKPKDTLLIRARPTKFMVSKSHSTIGAHSFYFPTDTLGGKSPGYAWGYAGSFPRREQSSGYIRNTMRKGLSQERYLELTGAANGCSSRGTRRKF